LIETSFDVPFIADLALHEKQIQQNYRPIIAIHKWFARRPGTLFRGLLLSEFVGGSLRDSFFRSHNLKGLRMLDPFMGGGTPLIEANRIGCDIIGYDINPMAYWIVRQEIDYLDTESYMKAARQLRGGLENQVGEFYRTKCLICGSPEAHVKYFIWVKTHRCGQCGRVFDLFPGYVLAENRRHPAFVFICSLCGALNEAEDSRNPGRCCACGGRLRSHGVAGHSRCTCPNCKEANTYPSASEGPPRHRMIAIEYLCPACKPGQKGRFFKKPDSEDIGKYAEASARLATMRVNYVPEDEIPPGDETNRLHRWGYHKYREMFNDRQLLGLELSCQAICEQSDEHIRNALATNVSDLLRYQNMLCRYDAMALKSLDIFSVHGFPVGLMQCESNVLGIIGSDGKTNVGSGGWSNIIDKYVRAKTYCQNVFEIKHEGGRKVFVNVPDEWIGDTKWGDNRARKRQVELHCGSSTSAELPPNSVDAVFTDPPYFTNVQYAELMDFCYVWLRRLAVNAGKYFERPSTRDENELTGNTTMERGIVHFTEGLAAVFAKMAGALKPAAPLVFTYHHNTIEAYLPVAVAVLDAGLKCSASIPCPAEMGASIHINGTGSSIVDTVFVCRSTGVISRRIIASTPPEIARLVLADLADLRAANLKPTWGDIRCIAYGHLVRLAIWTLKETWDRELSTREKLDIVLVAIDKPGGWSAVERCLADEVGAVPKYQSWAVAEGQTEYGGLVDVVSF
jgi:putative DNA methylase